MGFLDGLAKSFQLTGVDENIETGIGSRQVAAAERTAKHRIRHGGFQLRTTRAIADDDELHIGPSG